jgi:hypothetical protein
MTSPAAQKYRCGPPAALPGVDLCRRVWRDGAHCPCAARHAASGNIFPMAVPDQAQLLQNKLSCSSGEGYTTTTTTAHTLSLILGISF